ncbi:hypothetical protein ACFQ4O_17520, partial [Methylopila musalis]
RRGTALFVGAGVAAVVAAAAIGWALRGGDAPTPPDPVPPQVSALTVEEIRAPAAGSCAQALFGSAQPERRPVAIDATAAAAPSRLDGRLCGLSFHAADASIRLSGGLAAVSIAPRMEPGGGVTYLLRSNVTQNVVYEVQAVSNTDGRVVQRLVHQLVP